MGSRFARVVLAACVCEVTAGCNGPPAPQPVTRFIAAGTVERLTLWERPVQRPGELGQNTGQSTFKGNRVEVYDQFLLITLPGNQIILAPNGWYSDFAFRRDPQK
jgi:hypothetical protein